MRVPFVVFIRALAFYALITIPAIGWPIAYLLSLAFVVTFGWFAWLAFTCIYFLIRNSKLSYSGKQVFLYPGVIASVAFAFQMINVMDAEFDVWHLDLFLLFPMAACIAGWISLTISFSREVNFFGTVPEEKDEAGLTE